MRDDESQTLASKELARQKLYDFDDMVNFMSKVDFDLRQFVSLKKPKGHGGSVIDSKEEYPLLY